MNTENDWNRRDIIKKIKHYRTNNQKSKGLWYFVIQTEYLNTSTLIIKQANKWNVVNESHECTYWK